MARAPTLIRVQFNCFVHLYDIHVRADREMDEPNALQSKGRAIGHGRVCVCVCLCVCPCSIACAILGAYTTCINRRSPQGSQSCNKMSKHQDVRSKLC